MEADYSGGQSSPWAAAPRGKKEGIEKELYLLSAEMYIFKEISDLDI
jgi:hypothetical protein